MSKEVAVINAIETINEAADVLTSFNEDLKELLSSEQYNLMSEEQKQELEELEVLLRIIVKTVRNM